MRQAVRQTPSVAQAHRMSAPHRLDRQEVTAPAKTPSGNRRGKGGDRLQAARNAPHGHCRRFGPYAAGRDVAAVLAVGERTVGDRWRAWRLPTCRIGKYLRWRERGVCARIDRQAA